MMTVFAVPELDMGIEASGGGEGLVEFPPHVLFLPGQHRRKQLIAPPFQPGTAGEIHGDLGQRLVHGTLAHAARVMPLRSPSA